MSTLADPTICPDCRAPLDPSSVCTGCGLVLQGAPAAELWVHLQHADRLIEGLRAPAPLPAFVPTTAGPAAPAVPAAPTAPSAPAAPLPPPTGLPVAPPAYVPPPRNRGLSVPAVLLGLGAVCVLVAAVVFVAVTWSSLGLAGRTTILVLVTAVAAGAAAWVTRRGLRLGAEALWLVTHVLITIDVVAAAVADLAGLGSVDPQHVVAGLGVTLLASSLGVSLWVRDTRIPRLYGMVAVTALGTLLVTAAEAWAADRSALGTAVSLPLLAGLTALLARVPERRLVPQAWAVAAVGALSWLVLVGHGLSRAESTTASAWWQDLAGWPFLVAALVAAAVTGARTVAEPARSVAAGAALACLALLALGGTASAETKVLVSCAVAAALAAVAAYASRVWAWPATALVTLAGLLAVPSTLLRPFGVLEGLPTTAPARGAGLDLGLPATTWDLASWTAPVVAAVAALCLLALTRFLTDAARGAARTGWTGCAPVLVGLGLVTWFLETGPQLTPAVAAWSVLLVGAAALTVLLSRSDDRDPALLAFLVLDVYLVGVGLRLAVPSHLLVAVLASAVALVLAVGAARAGTQRLQGALVPVLSGAAALAAFFSATHWPYLAGGTGDAAGLALALLAAAVGLSAVLLGRTPAARVTLEATGLVGGMVALAFTGDAVVSAAILTITGTAVALVSVRDRDRDLLSWLASGLLALAVLVRAGDGAAAPELVALPAAALLVAAGVRRLVLDPEASSRRTLASGLALGLTPSLLGALDDPVSLRGTAVAAAGLAFLALGAVRRWGAPFVAGAIVVAVMALRHLGPVAEALPRWISLGSVGVALLVVGITWEARRRDARKAERYLAALR